MFNFINKIICNFFDHKYEVVDKSKEDEFRDHNNFLNAEPIEFAKCARCDHKVFLEYSLDKIDYSKIKKDEINNETKIF